MIVEDKCIMSEFEINDSNIYINQVYSENENYKIIFNNCNTRKCIVFFSGNGLYYPNTLEVFQKVVINEDRYEWQNVAKESSIIQNYQMIILIRDVYKTFYQKGISNSLNSIDRVLQFLKEKTKGYKVTTCGNSAGGYMATIAGYHLNAEAVFTFGGQWNIDKEPGCFLGKTDTYGRKYYDIINYAQENVIWFWSAYSKQDCEQRDYLGNYINNISSFAISSKYHGDLLLYPCYKNILVLSLEEIQRIERKYGKKTISQRTIAKDFLQGKELCHTCVKDIIRHHKSLQIMCTLFKKVIG